MGCTVGPVGGRTVGLPHRRLEKARIERLLYQWLGQESHPMLRREEGQEQRYTQIWHCEDLEQMLRFGGGKPLIEVGQRLQMQDIVLRYHRGPGEYAGVRCRERRTRLVRVRAKEGPEPAATLSRRLGRAGAVARRARLSTRTPIGQVQCAAKRADEELAFLCGRPHGDGIAHVPLTLRRQLVPRRRHKHLED